MIAILRNEYVTSLKRRDRPTVQPGDILIEKNSGLWGFGAKLLFGADHQHACLVTHDITHAIEAIWSGVRINPINSEDIGTRYEVWRPRCESSVRFRSVFRALTRAGEAYGYGQLFLAAVKRHLGMRVPDVPGMWCSELISWSYSTAGYDLHESLEDHLTGPWDLRNPTRLERIA